jgi:nucleoside-diphosphate-sugar epimerase
VDGVMTEDTPYNPRSRKGDVRARIATTLMDEVKRGELHAMIVRAADFYGPHASLSVTHTTVTERLKEKKTPRWLGNAKAVHTFTYTPDAGRSLAVLGNTASAYGQVWHALTSKETTRTPNGLTSTARFSVRDSIAPNAVPMAVAPST